MTVLEQLKLERLVLTLGKKIEKLEAQAENIKNSQRLCAKRFGKLAETSNVSESEWRNLKTEMTRHNKELNETHYALDQLNDLKEILFEEL